MKSPSLSQAIPAAGVFACPDHFAPCARRVFVYPLRSEGEGAIEPGNDVAASGSAQLDAAHKALREDSSIQFNLTPPDPPPQLPQWLRDFFHWLDGVLAPIGKFLDWVTSFMPASLLARAFLWTVLGIAAAALLWALYNRLRHGEWRLRLPRLSSRQDEPSEDWAPEEAPALSWLEEAEALARQGRYSEAIHHLLFRSIEDIAKRRPNLVRPALTSRELAASPAVPARARSLFASIAAVVERSLFGGSAVVESDWVEARDAYAQFALAGSWRG